MSITNAEAITFSNEKIRVAADLMAKLYNLGISINAEWDARSLGSIIPDDSNEILKDSAYGSDGTDGDGRPVVTGEDLNNIVKGDLIDFVATLEANSNAKLNAILSVAVNTGG